MISKQDVQHIAKLARLGLTEREIKKFQKELSKILDYIEKLKEVDVCGIEPSLHSAQPLSYGLGIMREDKESSKFKVQSSKLIELAPEIKRGYLKVKKII
ncbi:MAG: Asp-tRNA(Asn)/Glu-tRNA(Gln) amidotransferase subunit GatC [Thermodesulfovibrionales bacterium]|nr:Asp-tRNA(Asn)/Glu-tRNA(Gln) amidotransferase subunit GatC [Thermodesulfovibrionales bacterium]